MNTASYSKRSAPFTALLVWLASLCFVLPSLANAQDNSVPATQQAVIEIIRLQYRDPDTVREAIAPHLDERGSISQIDHNLIISTSRANLTELEALIAEVDTPLKQFLVRVDFNFSQQQPQRQPDGSTISTISTQDVRDHPIQNLVVTEGEFAYFNRSIATPRSSVSYGPFGLQLHQDIEESEQSFTVQAGLRGDRVAFTMSLTHTLMFELGGSSYSQNIETSLVADLNTWVGIHPVIEPGNSSGGRTRFNTAIPPEGGSLAVRFELMP